MNTDRRGKNGSSERVSTAMTDFLRSHVLAVSATLVVLLGAAAWLAFGYFGVHTLFIDDVVDEALPTFEQSAPAPGAGTEPTPATPAPAPIPPADETPADVPEADVDDVSDDVSDDTEAAPMVEASGSFESLGRYTTVGSVLVLGDGSGQRFLRFEDFETSNGPDLEVYLVDSSTGDVSDFVSLGRLSGNIGNQNYEIPPEVDLSVYDTVMIWCVRFSSGFGQATLVA